MPRLGTPSILTGENSSNRLPSNRTSPPSVLTHKKPSADCSTPVTSLSGRPSSVRHSRANHSPPEPSTRQTETSIRSGTAPTVQPENKLMSALRTAVSYQAQPQSPPRRSHPLIDSLIH